MSSSAKSSGSSKFPARKQSSSGLFGTLRALTGTSKNKGDSQDHGSPVPIPELQTINSPPSVEVELAFAQLDPRCPLELRITAAKLLSKILPQIPKEGRTMRIWGRGMDLLDLEPRVGYELLLACVKDDALTLPELEVFCTSVARPIKGFLKQRAKACSDISSGGHTIPAGLESIYITLVVELLGQSFLAAALDRRQGIAGEPASDNVECLQILFQVLIVFINNHSDALQSKDVDKVITQVLKICKKTTSQADMQDSLQVLETLVLCLVLPRHFLLEIIELLAGIYIMVESFKQKAWSLMESILHSSLGLDAVSDLFRILKRRDPKTGWETNVICGAVRFFRLILVVSTRAELPEIGIIELLAALLPAVQSTFDAQLEVDILQLLKVLIDENDRVELVFGIAEWNTYSHILLHCSSREDGAYRDFPIDSWSPTQESESNSEAGSEEEPLWSDVLLQRITSKLVAFCQERNLDRRHLVMAFLLNMIHKLDDETAGALLQFHDEQGLLRPPNESWQATCRKIYQSTFTDRRRSSALRLRVVNTVLGSYKLADTLNLDGIKDVIVTVMESMLTETDVEVLEGLVSAAVNLGTSTKKEELFQSIVSTVILALKTFFPAEGSHYPNNPSSPVYDPSMDATALLVPEKTASIVLAQALVRLFLQNLIDTSWKCQIVFEAMLQIADSNDIPADSRVTVLKLFGRLRCNLDYAIFVKPTTNCQGLASALCRTAETIGNYGTQPESPASRPTRPVDHMAKRSSQLPASGEIKLARNTSRSGRSLPLTNRKSRPTPPLWLYPGTRALPQEPPDRPSNCLVSVVVERDSDHTDAMATSPTLQIGRWLEFVLKILQQDELEWEVYSYVVVHLGAQLSNHSLFVKTAPQLKLLRSVICSQLLNNSFHEPPNWTNLKRPDVSVCLYQILTVLVTYHKYFAKSEEEEIVKVFAFGIGSSERSTEACIHGLSICCHELPKAVSKWLVAGLDRMSRIITQTHLAVHVLEFLAGVARSPDLFKDFREDEFRMVFKICFQYLDYVREQKLKEIKRQNDKSSLQTASRLTSAHDESRSSSELASHLQQATQTSKSLAAEIPQYVHALAYHVMTFWFMSLKLSDRPSKLLWIRNHLYFTNESGERTMEEQAQVVVDFMNRVAFSDRDETQPDPDFADEADGPILKKSWLSGMSILTIETAGHSGASRITRRRPSGTKYMVLKPSLVQPPPHQVPTSYGLMSDKFSSHFSEIMPDDIVQSMYTAADISAGNVPTIPMVVPEDEASQRAISTFDRISPLDGHKVGIIYIGPGQRVEGEILANESGSDGYNQFLDGIGTRVELCGAKFNTQGLDRHADSDGKFAICWRDRVTELVFHTTTMMPTDLVNDPHCASKKRHTGNDFVNIIFDESGIAYDFDTFPSAFNYINIHITPEIEASLSTGYNQALRRQRRADLTQPDSQYDQAQARLPLTEEPMDVFYNVTVLTKSGLPNISPAAASKTISGTALPGFARLLALNASVFALAWANRDAGAEHIGSWRGRLREIQRLKTRLQSVAAATDLESSEV